MIFSLGLFIFLFGLMVGSFLNCVIYRLEQGENFLKGRSYCPQCKKTLHWLDLVPVVSFLFLKGKCHYCKKPISLQYPLVELATGLLFLLIFAYLPAGRSLFVLNGLIVGWFAVFYSLITCFLIIIFVYDLKHYIIPDKVIYPAIIIVAVFGLLQDPALFVMSSFVSALGAVAFFLGIVLISRGKWMGIGDIKLAFLMGLMLGWPNIMVALFLAFLMGATVGIALIIINKKTLKSEVPFGPFLAAGTMIALLFGQNIINWYLKFFLLQ